MKGLHLTVPVPTAHHMAPSPTIPVPPSPTTRLRRNVAKVTRHLGEDVPSELVSGNRMPPLQEEVSGEPVDDSFPRVTIQHSLEISDELAPLPLEDKKWSKHSIDLDTPQVGGVFVITGSMNGKRYSRHWYREKNGKRIEKDYREVLAGLRKL
jgi:hypothetical protein